MSSISFPILIFQTKNRMDDYSAKDMHYGDLTAEQLITQYGLHYVSNKVDPYSLSRRAMVDQPQSMFCCQLYGRSEKVSRQHAISLLFDEFRWLSRAFSFYGPYKYLIEKMITHMQHGDGTPFSDSALNKALEEQILRDNTRNSTRIRLEEAIKNRIHSVIPEEISYLLRIVILQGKLPKFDRLQDSINGMGISVHDTWATHITLKSLQINNSHYRAIIHYNVQDHFGLDSDDILKTQFKQFQLFRLWFVLQRYTEFGFKPFMTNMEASIEISGKLT